MKRKLSSRVLLYGLPVVLATAVAVISVAQDGTPAASRRKETDIFSETQKFTEIYSYIRRMYFRPVDEQVLLHGAIEGLLQAVDRNNSFIPDTREVGADEDPSAIAARGVGIVFGFASLQGFGNSVPVVLSVLPGSPAAEKGVRPESILWQVGERVVVNGEILARNVYEQLTPAAGQSVNVVLYDPVEGRRELSLASGRASVPRQIEVGELEAGIVHVRLPVLVTEQAVTELHKLLQSRKDALRKGIILDLRESSLGDPRIGYELADLFIRDGAQLGRLLVQREDGKMAPKRGPKGEETLFRAGDGQAHLDMPIVALVDFTSAGPAEILAGALKHAGRGRVVGVRSFGYAPFRERFVFEKGAQIVLTTALYSTGQDKVYMGEGVEPDVKVESKDSGELLAQAIEEEASAAEEDGAPVPSAEPQPATDAAPQQDDEDRLLEAAVREVLKLRGEAPASKPQAPAKKPQSDVG
jgi:carboxyl-terminal processing protease